MKKLKVPFIVVCVFILSLSVKAQNNLDYFINQAIENSAILKDQSNQIAISKLEMQRLTREISGFKIYGTADLLFAPYFNNPKLIDTNPEAQAYGYDPGITNGGLYSALINASQPIFTSGILDANLLAQQATRTQSRYVSEQAKTDLKKQVTDQYITVYSDQEMAKVNNDLLSIISDQSVVFQKLADAGLRKPSDAKVVQLERKNQEANIRASKLKWRQDYLDLYILCGLADTAMTPLDPPIFPSESLSDTLSVYKAKFVADSLNAVATAAVFDTKYKASANVFANGGLNAVEFDRIPHNVGFSLGFGLRVPIYDGRQRELNDQKKMLGLKTAEAYKVQMQQEVSSTITKFQNAIMVQRQNLEMLRNQSQDYQSLFDQYKVELKSGLISVIDYVNGFQLYQNYRSNVVQAQSNLYTLQSGYHYWNRK